MAEVKTYFQVEEPADSTPGTTWIVEDGSRSQRGTDGSWRAMGNVNLDNGGSVKRSGDSMDGALEGSHGLAPLNAPNFTTNALLEDADLATKTWVQAKIDALNEVLTDAITTATDGSTPDFGIFDYMAFGSGVVASGGAIPLPKYKLGTGTTAQISEIVAVLVSPKTVHGRSDGITSFDWTIECSADASTVVTCNFQGWAEAASTANYLIICAKNPS